MDVAYILLGIVVIKIASYLLENYFPSYFNKKGENLATKEDIEEITKKIKTVEHNIQFITDNKFEYSSLKRKVIIEYFGACVLCTRSMSSNFKFDRDIAIRKGSYDIMKKPYDDYLLREGEIELFIEEEKFVDLKNNFLNQIAEFVIIYNKYCSKKLDDNNYSKETSETMNECIKAQRNGVDPARNELMVYLRQELKNLSTIKATE